MSKKPISFGKINFNLNKKAENDKSENEEATSGFGTFGRTLIQEHKEIEEISDDLENQHVHQVMGIKNFGKKAKNFDIDEMMVQAKKTASEVNKRKLEAELGAKSNENNKGEADDVIGPLPPGTDEESNQNSTENDSEDDLIGPTLPPTMTQAETSKEKEGKVKNSDEEDSYDELSGSDDEDASLEKRIPNTHEVEMLHGTKAVVALAVDPSGARLATGSIDYDVSFWDFAGMDSSLRPFRTLQPCEKHPMRALQYSATGDRVLLVSGAAQAKVVDRDGFEVLECVKGDQYIADMARTKGHTASLNSGCWHPHIREEFMTCSQDGTLRLWLTENPKQHKAVIKPRQQGGLKTNPTACAYSRDGNTVACGCYDGSVQMWDHRKAFVNTTQVLRDAHQKQSEISSISYSYLGTYLSTRGNDDTLKLWDLRSFKKPLNVFSGLFSRYEQTDCGFSPDDTMVFTGESLQRGQDVGRLLFYDTKTFELVSHINVTKSHVIKAVWHAKLNQIFVGCGNGVVKCYYDHKRSLRGAKLCIVKTHRKKHSVEVVSSQQIITPHALPLFRQEKLRTSKKRMEKDRLDPVKSRRPDLPITSGQGGRVAASGSTLSSFVIRNLGLSKRVDDEQDPREAILKYAKEAEENPFWVAPAYKKTQPKAIFQTDGEDGPPDAKKSKT
ncbi:gastrulation defective protein 1 homolog [Plodia interpunctella]|uniref:gastrulation defective protein 1 homolog n=1 Tax=Plodia interpunctella TaxID=58824 RepID=UPI0023680FE2|nr:gastrulation defective protein 1 homolog [Plodia interpunctella]